jgi:RNA-directed DNA polymerase
MASLEKFLWERLRLKVNRAKSAVARPWQRKFLGYSVTVDRVPRLRVAPESVKRLRAKLQLVFRRGRGRRLDRVIQELNPVIRGWVAYFRMSDLRVSFEELDGWIRRKLRCLLWRQWKRPWTRRARLIARGLSEEHARVSAYNGHGPWWNAGASHMHQASLLATYSVLLEPPCTEPYARWCGSWGRASAPSYLIYLMIRTL